MANPTNERLKKILAQVQEKDPKLKQELQDKRASAALREESKYIKEEVLAEHGDIRESFDEDYALEAVVLRVGRPVLIINNSEANLVFEDAESEVWRERLQNAKQHLALSIPAIGRIELVNHPSLDWCGTGWLMDKTTIVTNRHVAELFGKMNGTGFVFRQGENGNPMSGMIDLLEEYNRPDERRLKIKRILHIEQDGGPDIAFLEAEPDSDITPTPIELETWAPVPQTEVAVVGYPAKDSRMPDAALMQSIFKNVYDKKRLAPGMITSVKPNQLLHDCSTLGGCSGSAIINLRTGKALGLHFAGRFLQANYAVPASVVRQRYNDVITRRPMISTVTNEDKTTMQTDNSITTSNGSITLSIPLNITISLGQPAGQQSPTAATSTKPQGKVSSDSAVVVQEDEFITEGRPEDYADRKGYDQDFLGEDFRVPLPEPSTEKRKKDVLTYDLDGQEEKILRYQHFSVLMSKSRRMCFYSAVNINGAKSKKATRVGWRLDPRIPNDAQIMHECYGNAPKYSRGHMTRREDPVWGREEEALRGNADSMCVTNTTPQMQSFNAPVWLALEDYALQNARQDKMRISVFTGPIFRNNDEVQYGVRIPEQFWKIIVFIHDETDQLSATGYIMSQEEHMPDVEFVFGEFGTAQVSIASIEKKTGLSFGDLAQFDPMNQEAAGDPIRQLSDASQIKFV